MITRFKLDEYVQNTTGFLVIGVIGDIFICGEGVLDTTASCISHFSRQR